VKKEKEEVKSSQGDAGDFKNSLAALIGRGKPTYKKPPVEEKKAEEKAKVKTDLFNEESDEEDTQAKSKPSAAIRD